MPRLHRYEVGVTWNGDRGSGTSGLRDYARDNEVTADGRPPIECSADPLMGGVGSRWNPEQFLVAALSECHMLWYLHLCAQSGVVVTSYTDRATGSMTEHRDGGAFNEVTLHPRVKVSASTMITNAIRLHDEAHRACFIANSVNFPVHVAPEVTS